MTSPTEKTGGRPVFFWAALIALIFTFVMVRWSSDRFRLTSAPYIDDASWLNEGIAMRDAFRDGGIGGFLHHIVETRTLSPYSIVAAAGFAIFGIEDWAPYLMNGGLIFSLLAFLEIARRRYGMPLQAWFLAAALALAFPISGYSIVSFLGDVPTGLFIAIGSIAFLEGWPASESKVESWTGTVAWIFAFYGKATLFPETILIFVVSAGAGWFFNSSRWARRASMGGRISDACVRTERPIENRPQDEILPYRRQATENDGLSHQNVQTPDAGTSACAPQRALVRKWAVRAGVVLLAILPYYILIARNLIDYLHLQNFGALRDVWAFKGTAWESLTYYLTGASGTTMLGPALYLALALIAVRCVLLFRESVRERFRFAVLLAIIVISYVLPTMLVNKTTTVGAPFQFLIVLTAVACFYRIGGTVMSAVTAVAVLLLFRFPIPLDRADSPAIVARHRTLDGLIGALEREQVGRGEPVFLTTTGFLGAHTLHYEFLKRRLPLPHFSELSLSNDASKFAPMIDSAAYVIATDGGNDEVFYTAPSAFIQADTLALVQQNPAFVEVARFSTWRGKHYYLFGRRDRVRNPAPAAASDDPPPPGPVFLRGCSNPGADGNRWSQREFDIEFPAPRGLYAELKLRFFLPRPHIDKLGAITLSADVEREGRHSETFGNDGIHEFTFRYVIKQPLVSTVPVRFRLNKAMPGNAPGDEFGLLLISADLAPVSHL